VKEENLVTNYFNPEDISKTFDSEKGKCESGQEGETGEKPKNSDKGENCEKERNVEKVGKNLISDDILDHLESDDVEIKGAEISDKRRWLLSRIVNGEKKEIHLAQALKLLVPREYVSRERSRRHIAAKFLPDRHEVDKQHNVFAFRFVVAKVSGKVAVCKVAALNNNGKSVKSASNLDESVTCQLIPLQKLSEEKNLYILPKKIVVSNWIKVLNIKGELKMSCNEDGEYSVIDKSLSVLEAAEDSDLLSEDLKCAKQLSNSLPPLGFHEVNDVIDKKLDPKTEEYLYLVKFKGEEQSDPVWLSQSCFDRPIHFSKRKGFASEKVFACDESFMKFALNAESPSVKAKAPQKRQSKMPSDIKNALKRTKKPGNPMKRKSSPSSHIPEIKKKRVFVGETSKAKLEAFSFVRTEDQKKLVIDVDLIMVDREEKSFTTDKEIFKVSLEKVSSGQWLNDVVMQKVNEMIKVQYPSIRGLQDPLNSKRKSMLSPVPVDNNCTSVQIHHNGCKHWVLSTSIGNDVFLYDSLNEKPSENLKDQLFSCYSNCQEDGRLKVCKKRVFLQTGGEDCGLYCIAYAVDIVNGRSPESILYDQDVMRKHLLDCIAKDNLTPFPEREIVDISDIETLWPPFFITRK